MELWSCGLFFSGTTFVPSFFFSRTMVVPWSCRLFFLYYHPRTTSFFPTTTLAPSLFLYYHIRTTSFFPTTTLPPSLFSFAPPSHHLFSRTTSPPSRISHYSENFSTSKSLILSTSVCIHHL